MSDIEFALGQRWVSNSEPELGLGIIEALDTRRVAVLFPAAQEQRYYAQDNAPLSRVAYQQGDQIRCRDQRVMTVTARELVNACYIYVAVDADGQSEAVHEMDLDAAVQFSQPQDRLFAGQIDKISQFNLRARALHYQHLLAQSSTAGLLGPRVQLLPHQLYIANEVGQRHAPRVLLADEVGLGKTIEAGLILHQQLFTGRVSRVLIVVPDSLLHQWLVEMLRRFNLHFTVLDSEHYSAINELNEGNPFESAQLMLTTLSSLMDPAMAEDALAADWDMLVVDEAHHLLWSEQQSSPQYQLIELLAENIAGLLLLTATPEQLGKASHFARLRLLDPERYHDLNAFIEEEQRYEQLSALLEQIDNSQSIEDLEQIRLQLTELMPELEQLIQQEQQHVDLKSALTRNLLDLHGTGRILFRNTRDVISGFPARQLHAYPLEADAEQTAELQTQPRVLWLVDFLKQHRQHKVLLICAEDSTAVALEQHLRIDKGLRTAVFHRDMTLINRDRAAAYFAEEESGAQLLVCSEIGSEGRNFQFAQHLVLFDLPETPDLLEQRIGRLDRIGQKHAIQIHVPYYLNSPEAVLFEWYQQGLDAFEHVCAIGDQVKQAVGDLLDLALQNPADRDATDNLIKQTQTMRSSLLKQLEQGRDRLLERNSFNPAKADELLQQLEDVSEPLQLADFMDEVFSEFGVEQQHHSADTIIIEPGTHMLYEQFPALPRDGVTATFLRHKALSRDDLMFLTWEHPMVSGALDMIINSEIGNSSFATFSCQQFPAGSLMLEALLQLRCSAPKSLQMQRYIEQATLRVLVDDTGKNWAQQWQFDALLPLLGRIPRSTAQQLVTHGRDKIEQLIQQVNATIEPNKLSLINQAKQAISQHFDEEITRMQALSARNPNIRPEELEQLKAEKQLALNTVEQAELTLDAIRVLIVVEPN